MLWLTGHKGVVESQLKFKPSQMLSDFMWIVNPHPDYDAQGWRFRPHNQSCRAWASFDHGLPNNREYLSSTHHIDDCECRPDYNSANIKAYVLDNSFGHDLPLVSHFYGKGAGFIFLSPNFILNMSVMMFTPDPPLINAFGTRLFFTITDIMGISSSNAFAVTLYVWVCFFYFFLIC